MLSSLKKVGNCYTKQIARQKINILFDRPLQWLLPFYLLGIILADYHTLWHDVPLIFLSAFILSLGLIIFNYYSKVKSKVVNIIILAISVFLLGFGLTQSNLAYPKSPNHLFNLKEINEYHILEGQVVQTPVSVNKGYQILVSSKYLITPGKFEPEKIKKVEGLIKIKVGTDESFTFKKGDLLRFPIVLNQIKGFQNPGSFNSTKYWASQNVWLEGYLKSGKLISLHSHDNLNIIDRFKIRADKFIETASFGRAKGLLKAQILGQRTEVDKTSESSFRALGLSHILAVSGLHLGLCYGIYFFIFRFILSYLIVFLPRMNLNFASGFVALIPALAYAAVVGGASSVLRATFMIAAITLGILSLKKVESWNILFLAAWGILLWEPYRLFTASFQLSFIATASLLAAFAKKKKKSKNNKILTACKVSIVAGLGTLPIVVWHFSRFPLWGLLANIILTPLLSILVMPFGLIAIFLEPISKSIAFYLLQVPVYGLNLIMPYLDIFSNWAGQGILLPYYGIILVAGFYMSGYTFLKSNGTLWQSFKKALCVFILFFILNSLVNFINPPYKGKLRFVALDVGQGTAQHINFPDGTQMLIDSGGLASFDIGENLLMPYFMRKGITKLDIMVVSHPDFDHFGAMISLSNYLRIKEFWSLPWSRQYSRQYSFLLDTLAHKGVNLVDSKDFRKVWNFGGAYLTVLWPYEKIDNLPTDYKGVNDNSLVIKIEYKGKSILITGDIGAETEKNLVKNYGSFLKSDVLMAPHHGGKNTLSLEFLKLVQPEYIIFSSGRFNNYNQPHPETIDKAKKSGAKLWRTDLMGFYEIEY